MELRECGRSGLKLSRLGLGCWAFGGGEYWGPQDQSDVDAVVRRAFEAGVNYFDTAEVYNEGRSEAALGHGFPHIHDAACGSWDEGPADSGVDEVWPSIRPPSVGTQPEPNSAAQRTPPAARIRVSSSVQWTTTRSLPPFGPRRSMTKRPSGVTS